MTREDEVEQVKALYQPWLIEIEMHIERLQSQQEMWNLRSGAFARIMRGVMRQKLWYARGQLKQMKQDYERALRRIP